MLLTCFYLKIVFFFFFCVIHVIEKCLLLILIIDLFKISQMNVYKYGDYFKS